MALMKVMAFDVKRCGYYRRGNKLPEFGGIREILSDIEKWTAPKSMVETKVFDATDDLMPVYCFDIRKTATENGILFTTWNEVPMTEGGVPVASGKAKVGQVKVEVAEVADGDIPGFPTYFYFMPNHKLLFSIRPEWQKLSGHQGLLKYMRSYLEKASSYVVIDAEDEDADNCIAGYRDGPIGKVLKLIPSYNSMPKRLPGQTDFLRANRESIRKMIRHDTLRLGMPKDRHLVGKLLENVGLLDRQVVQEYMTFKYELEFRPNAEELELFIGADAAEADAMVDRESKLGFMLTGSHEVFWLDHAFAKDDIEIKATVGENGVIQPKELLKELEKKHYALLELANVAANPPLGNKVLKDNEKVEA